MKLPFPGYTFVEIIIVVAIIIIVTSIAVVGVFRANIISNEAYAMANLRRVYTALLIYYTNNNRTYPETLDQMNVYVNPAGSAKYEFVYTYVNEAEFYINTSPQTLAAGIRFFYLDETGTIRYNMEREANENDPPVE